MIYLPLLQHSEGELHPAPVRPHPAVDGMDEALGLPLMLGAPLGSPLVTVSPQMNDSLLALYWAYPGNNILDIYWKYFIDPIYTANHQYNSIYIAIFEVCAIYIAIYLLHILLTILSK